MQNENKKGFTFIELIVVISIMGVLTALITGNYFSSLKRGRDSRRKSDLEQIQKALEMYYEDNHSYPTTLSFGIRFFKNLGGTTDYEQNIDQLYMDKVPNDPINGQSYGYVSDSVSYKLFSCLENTQQILPYSTEINSSTYPAGFLCSTKCYLKNGTTIANCVWVITSPNISIP